MNKEKPDNIIEQHIEIINVETNILDLLAEQTGLSKQQLKMAMTKGAVWISKGADSKKAKPIRRKNTKIVGGDYIHLYFNPSVLAEQVKLPKLVADHGDYSVWDKPYGVWSQGSKWGDHCSITRLVEKYFEYTRPAFIVHRLDRAANGLILVAHNKKAAAALAELFATRALEKKYRALVQGEFIASQQIIESEIDNKVARSIVRSISYDSKMNQSVVEVQIETGRKHQIRIHLSSIGFPIVGDRLYGNARQDDIDLQLTSFQLNFTCPITNEAKSYQLPERENE